MYQGDQNNYQNGYAQQNGYDQGQYNQQYNQQQQYGQQQQYDQGQYQQQNNSQEEQITQQFQEFIESADARDGLRFSWNQFPPNRIEGTRNVVPLGCLYTPLQRSENPSVSYPPILYQNF